LIKPQGAKLTKKQIEMKQNQRVISQENLISDFLLDYQISGFKFFKQINRERRR